MAKELDISQLAMFIADSQDEVAVAGTRAMIKVMQDAENQAKKNSREQFIGRNDRRLSGGLFNAIKKGFENEGTGKIPAGVLGTVGIPYGAMMEFGSADLPGGKIVPLFPAQRLWIPQHKNAKKMTPREFITLLNEKPDEFGLFGWKSGGKPGVAFKKLKRKSKGSKIKPLFFLVDEVTVPERPYVGPAMEQAMEQYPVQFANFLFGT